MYWTNPDRGPEFVNCQIKAYGVRFDVSRLQHVASGAASHATITSQNVGYATTTSSKPAIFVLTMAHYKIVTFRYILIL